MKTELSGLLIREAKTQNSIDLYHVLYGIEDPDIKKLEQENVGSQVRESGSIGTEVTEKRFTFSEDSPPVFEKDEIPAALQVLRTSWL